MKTPRLLLLLIASALAACGGGSRSNSSTSARAAPLSSDGVNATLRIQSDWKTGYCADVTLENTSGVAVTWWTVVADLHQSALTDSWNGTVSASGSQITVTPAAGNGTIAAGGSLNAFGFCGSATGSTYLPGGGGGGGVGGGGGGGGSDFALSANPAAGTLPQGSSGSSTITIDRSGYTGSVALAVSGLPAGVTATLDPATTTGTTSTLSVAVSASAAPGTSTLTVTGTGGGITRTVPLSLTVSGGSSDFTLSASPAGGTLPRGASGSSTITIDRSGYSGSVALTVSGVPAGVTATLDRAATTGTTSTLTVSVSSGAAPGTSTLTVTGTGGGVARTVPLALTVSGGGTPDFALSANPAGGTLPQGSSGASTITISRTGFSDGVALTVSGVPAGVTATLDPATTTGTTSTLGVEISPTAAPGTSTLTVTGTGGGLTRTVQLALTVSGGLVPDTTPPTAPGGLAATETTGSSVSLGWAASTDDVGVVAYDVYEGAELAASVTTTSATIFGLAASTAYTFTVKARDAAGNVSPASGAVTVTTAASRHQAPYPPVDASTCGSWALTENVCCARYCADDDRSEGCGGCGGDDSPQCVTVDAKACKSGEWPEVHAVSDAEPWHFSRSTHYGLTQGGACGFGLYGLCTSNAAFNDANLGAQCAAFCKAYPALCADPAGTTLRGNFAAPPGNYYTQFWPSLPGDRDNYLSCGECFEVVRTKKDGTDYQPGEAGYTLPVTLQITDSCPCSANSKWCCGSGRDHCGEISDFKYGCPLPPGPPDPPADHDPLPDESVHLDLSDIAMARLQTGSPGGSMVDGVIPIRYRRVPCPVVGNVYVWLRSGAGPYWFSLSVVNSAGPGSTTKVEARLPSGAWIALVRDQNYTSSRPQERYGAWVVPQGAGPFALPVPLRITEPSGKSITTTIKAWAPADASQTEMYYIDTGAQF